MFIDLEHGNDVIAVDQIARCTTHSNYNTVITLKDGQVLTHNTFYTAPRIASKAAPFIQAQPGYFKIGDFHATKPYRRRAVASPSLSWLGALSANSISPNPLLSRCLDLSVSVMRC